MNRRQAKTSNNENVRKIAIKLICIYKTSNKKYDSNIDKLPNSSTLQWVFYKQLEYRDTTLLYSSQ